MEFPADLSMLQPGQHAFLHVAGGRFLRFYEVVRKL
jgi:hypothetical protein